MREQHVFTDTDRRRLGHLISSEDVRAAASRQVLDDLERELEDSRSVHREYIPEDVVTMNSTVRLINTATGAELVCTIVYPEDVDLFDDGLSVLSPLGSSLIGCEEGDVVECVTPDGRAFWKVAEVVYQPERVGEFLL
jgi:regulator of nucleoside diphosphate kinase